MVMLIGSTGIRRSELMALVWTDINVQTMEVSITRSCVRNRFSDTKTECSRRPVPLHPLILEALLEWRRQSVYKGDGDFLFPLIRARREKAPQSRQSAEEEYSANNRTRRDQRQGYRLAQFPSHAWNSATLDLYTPAFSQQKRRQHQGSGIAAASTGCTG
jgi:integrase